MNSLVICLLRRPSAPSSWVCGGARCITSWNSVFKASGGHMRSSFTKRFLVKPPFKLNTWRRFSENSGGKQRSGDGEAPSYFRRFAELYVVLFGANAISNVLIHPESTLDYGIVNQFFPRGQEVDSPFWGTRLPHLFYIPASLAFFDLSVTAVFTKYFGLVSYAATPTPWLLNLYVYTWLAVGSYIALDAALNPAHEGRRVEQITSHWKPLTIGMGLQWHAQMMLNTFGSTAGGAIAMARNAFAVSLVFLPVKALGFGDCGEDGLSPHERKLNRLPPK